MAQHDYDIANQSGAAFRADLNAYLLAAASQNSGATAPSPSFAYQPWPDTTTGIFKIRNAANTAWISLFTISTGLMLAQGYPGSSGQNFAVNDLTASGAVTSSSPTARIGYATGAGGSVTQLTSITTSVSINKVSGSITTFEATRVAGSRNVFVVNNSVVAATDNILLQIVTATSGANYVVGTRYIVAGQFYVYLYNISGVDQTEAPVINFTILKGSIT